LKARKKRMGASVVFLAIASAADWRVRNCAFASSLRAIQIEPKKPIGQTMNCPKSSPSEWAKKQFWDSSVAGPHFPMAICHVTSGETTRPSACKTANAKKKLAAPNKAIVPRFPSVISNNAGGAPRIAGQSRGSRTGATSTRGDLNTVTIPIQNSMPNHVRNAIRKTAGIVQAGPAGRRSIRPSALLAIQAKGKRRRATSAARASQDEGCITAIASAAASRMYGSCGRTNVRKT